VRVEPERRIGPGEPGQPLNEVVAGGLSYRPPLRGRHMARIALVPRPLEVVALLGGAYLAVRNLDEYRGIPRGPSEPSRSNSTDTSERRALP
jgi:hypothetical protein